MTDVEISSVSSGSATVAKTQNSPFRPAWLAIPNSVLFLVFVSAHAALWTAVPFLRNHNLPLDVIEHIAWAREWEFGYHKHPPMVSWMLESAIWLFGRSDIVVYGLSQLCIALSLFLVWRIAAAALPPFSALAATLLCEGVVYHGFTSPEFNVNVASLPFWAAALFISHRLYTRPPAAMSTPLWIVLGVVTAGAMLAKYTGALLVLCLLVLFLAPPAWHWWRTRGPYWSICAFIIASFPHLIWLLANDFPTFDYALARGNGDEGGIVQRLLAPVAFAGSQIPAILPAIILVSIAAPFSFSRPRLSNRQDQFLILMGLGPLLILLLIALTFSLELKSMWGTTLFLIAGIMAMRWLKPAQSDASSKRLIIGIAAILGLGPLIYLVEPVIANTALDRPKRTQFPGIELARVVETAWEGRFDSPLPVAVGDEWLAGNVGHYATSRPSAFLNADPNQAPWMSIEKLAQSGGVVLWMADKYGSANQSLAESRYAPLNESLHLEEQSPIQLPWATTYQLPQVTVGWAIIPPQAQSTDKAGLTTRDLDNNLPQSE